MKTTLFEQASGKYRVLVILAAELLDTAAQKRQENLVEKLYFDWFNPMPKWRRG